MLNKRAVFINTASQVIVRFITLAFTLISIKLLTNYLGPAGVGNYNTITTYINFFIVIADLGLFSVAVREISKNPESEKRIISNVFNIRLTSALVASSVSVFIVYFTKYESNIKLGVLIASGFILFNLLASVYDMILQYRLKMQYSALAEFLSKLISIIALYSIIRSGGNFLWIISTITLSGFSILFFKWFFARKFLSVSLGYDRKIINWIFNISWPLGIVFIVNNLFFKIDTLMLFALKGPAAVGVYSVAYKVLEVIIFVGGYYASALKPALAQNIKGDKQGVASIVSKSFSLMMLLSFPIALVSILFSKEIITFISNEEFISGSPALIIISLALPFMYIDMLLSEILIANDERKKMIYISVFILLFNFSLNLLLIPYYSFLGAAAVTLVSEIVLFVVMFYFTKKIVQYYVDIKFLLKLSLLSFLVLIVSVILKDISQGINFFFQIALVVFLYLALVYKFSLVNKNTLKSILK